MKKILFLLLLMGIGGAALAYNNTYALIVGVADYRDYSPGTGDLTYTVPDARSFCAFLQTKKGGNVPAANIVLLLNSQASKANIIAQGKALFSKAKKDDRVIFYFSGHGGRGCFVPWDSDPLWFDDVKAMFRSAKSNTKLLFADACFSGSMRQDLAKNPNWKKRMEKSTKSASNMNIAVMMSCQGDETSIESSDLGNGLFTYYLMQGLGGMANSDGNRYVTIQELFYYVYHKVQDGAAARHHKQTPELFGKFDLRLIVANL